MEKKLLILGSDFGNYGSLRISDEAAKKGIKADFAHYMNLQFKAEAGDFNVTVNASPIDVYDYIYLKGAGVGDYSFYLAQDCLVRYLSHNTKIKLINKQLYREYGGEFNKLLQTLVLTKEGLPVVPSRYYGGDYFNALTSEKDFPVILKKLVSSLGVGVKKSDNLQQLQNQAGSMSLWKIMFQKFLPTMEDYRLIVVGEKVLGAMRRRAVNGQFVTNVASGGEYEQAELTAELKELALKTLEAFGADYGGVDIMYDESKNPYILELNKAAHFEGFEDCTGINVAGAIIDWYLE